MRKFLLLLSLSVLLVLSNEKVSAQKGSTGGSYNSGVGMRVDFGTGGTLVGISGKHFFNPNNAGEAYLLFGSGSTAIGAEYQYHGSIQNAEGLKWYAGLGPNILFYKGGGTDVLFRPLVGLDYKIVNVPLNIGFDWRPAFQVTHGTTFQAARFGIAFRYAF